MALKILDGFDQYGNVSGLLTRWVTSNPTGSLALATGRFGAGTGLAVEINRNAGQGNLVRDLPGNFTELYLGFAFKANSLGDGDRSVLYIVKGDEVVQIGLAFDTSGHLIAYRGTALETVLGTSTEVITQDVWCAIEMHVVCHPSAGVVQVKLDGTQVLNLTGVNTQRSGVNTNLNQLLMFGHNSGGGTKQWDDLWVADTSGGVNDSWLGDMRVKTVYPTGTGAADLWTPSSGASWECVDDVPPDGDASYVSDDTVGERATWALANIATDDVVHGIEVVCQARKDDATAREIATVIRTGGTNYDGSAAALTTSYAYYGTLYDENPGTSAGWTRAEIDGLEAGVKVAS